MGANMGAGLPETFEDQELDLRRLKELAGFFVRAPQRRPIVAAAALCLTFGIGISVAVFWPRTFDCTVRILAQRNLVLPALDNPTRAVPHEADNPTRNAADSILRRDNIVALVKQLDLVDRWEATRAPLLRAKDKLFGLLHHPTDEERLRDMIELLDKRLSVVADDSSVTISIQWPERDMAYEIVSLLQTNFLEARYDTSVNVIAEAIRILQERAKPQTAEVNAAFLELTRLETERKAEALRETSISSASHFERLHREIAHSKTGAEEESGDTPESVERRQRAHLLEAEQDRQLSEVQRQVVEASATLGPEHPRVLALKEQVARLSEMRAKMTVTNASEHTVAAGIVGTSARNEKATPTRSPAGIAPSPLALTPVELKDDSKTAMARARLTAASATSNELLSRIDAANIELDVTRAAFKYQYAVVRPAERPRRPIRPNVSLVLIGTAILAALLAFVVPGGIDLLRGRLIERWQIERGLQINILGELPPL
jgi:uncharacterized protein involved in exopolysaccharide biosynthesis